MLYPDRIMTHFVVAGKRAVMNNEIPDEVRGQIKDVCTTLILGNRRLTAKEAARFPMVPYNYIQHVYRWESIPI